jgi:cobalt-zinc-cadmium efflux system outer membrane protein
LQALRADLDLARANYTGALARLSALSGVAQPYTGVSGSVLALFDTSPAVGPVDPGRSTIYRTALAEREAANQRLAYERKRAIPDVTGSLGVRRLEREGRTRLSSASRCRCRCSTATGEYRRCARRSSRRRGARRIARTEAEAELRGAIAQAEASDARVRAAQASLATAQEGYRLARIAYEAARRR